MAPKAMFTLLIAIMMYTLGMREGMDHRMIELPSSRNYTLSKKFSIAWMFLISDLLAANTIGNNPSVREIEKYVVKQKH